MAGAVWSAGGVAYFSSAPGCNRAYAGRTKENTTAIFEPPPIVRLEDNAGFEKKP